MLVLWFGQSLARHKVLGTVGAVRPSCFCLSFSEISAAIGSNSNSRTPIEPLEFTEVVGDVASNRLRSDWASAEKGQKRDMRFLTAPVLTRYLIVVRKIDEVRRHVAAAHRRGDKIGLVPTMGALHAGHLSLVQTAREECDFLVVSLFVNPAQFGPHEDYDQYPRPFDSDLDACRDAGVDLVFCPETSSIYPRRFSTFVDVERLANVLEGEFRLGHFRGVATVVLKLLHIILPDVAYFGRKDYQQQLLVRTMCRDLDLPVEIRTCPTVRESDGLALSSRNRYLTPDERKSAISLSQSLKRAKVRLESGETDLAAVRGAMLDSIQAAPGVSVDYATVAHPETLEEIGEPIAEMIALVAARVGQVRLIDNLPIRLFTVR